MRKLRRAVVDWYYTTEHGEDGTVFDISNDEIKMILHYDSFVRVFYNNGRIIDNYNINSVEYLNDEREFTDLVEGIVNHEPDVPFVEEIL